jgi:replicative DNA helicase
MNGKEIVGQWDEAHGRARDVQAEQSVLGGCLTKPGILAWLDLEPEAFWDARHRAIWQAMRYLADGGKVVDEVTLSAELHTRGQLELAGGQLYLGELLLRCPTTDSVQAYAEVLRGHLVTRRMLRVFSGLPQRILAGEVGEELLGNVEASLESFAPVKGEENTDLASRCRVEMVEAVRENEQRARGVVTFSGVQTGITVLDRRIGGLPFGVPSVLGARPSTGKSTLALCIAKHAARAGIPTLIATYEDRAHVFADRVLAQESGVDVMRIATRNMDRADLAALTQVDGKTAGLNRVFVVHAHGLPMARLARMVRAYVRRHGVKLAIVDYLQLIPPGPEERRMSREERLEGYMNASADIAGTEDIAFLDVSQLNRGGEEEGRAPRLSDFRGSGAIEQVGKVIVALHPAVSDDEIELHLLKNHQGPTARLTVKWDRARCAIWG